jgi:tRNA (guanine-N7-)-methyltransferase
VSAESHILRFLDSPFNATEALMESEVNRPIRRVKTPAKDLFADPLTWDQIAPAIGPIELEIGSGKGLFLLSAASARPQHHFVGIELAAKFANGAADRLAKRGLSNAIMLRGDAQRFLAQIVPDQSLVAVHVYFPDPWWRNKHKKRRVLNERALQDIQRILAPDGQLHFWTDVLDYYEHICEQLMDTTTLIGPRFVPQRAAQHSMDYTTHFERRARTHGQPVYRAIFTKPS